MSGWLAKATNSLRHENTDTPQPFVLTCECGLEHNGLRRSRHQRIICKSCGAALFVLPKDVYPAPAARKPKKKKKRSRRRGDQSVPQQIAGTLSALPAAALTGLRDVAVRLLRSLQQTITSWLLAFRRFWTPFRLVLLSILIMVGITLTMVARSRALESARETVRIEAEAGMTALDQGELALARDHFSRATDALDRLGRDDPEAEQIRQRWRETTAMTRLLSQDLYTLFEEGDHAAAAGIEAEWEEQFRSRHRGKWIVLELPVIHDAELDTYRMPYRLPVGLEGRTVSIDVNVPVMKMLTFGEAPRTVIMAAPLHSCSLTANRRIWNLSLEADRAFLWTNLDTYEAVGLGFDDWQPQQRVQQILNSQAVAVGAARPTSEEP